MFYLRISFEISVFWTVFFSRVSFVHTDFQHSSCVMSVISTCNGMQFWIIGFKFEMKVLEWHNINSWNGNDKRKINLLEIVREKKWLNWNGWELCSGPLIWEQPWRKPHFVLFQIIIEMWSKSYVWNVVIDRGVF